MEMIIVANLVLRLLDKCFQIRVYKLSTADNRTPEKVLRDKQIVRFPANTPISTTSYVIL